MKDFARLAVGILLLGLAIFLSLNLDNPDVADAVPDEGDPATEVVTGDQPDWQADRPEVDGFTRSASHPEIVKPIFDQAPVVVAPPANPAVERRQPLLNQPPRISDQYRPTQTLAVTGQIQRESSLVPVQPKPSFTGAISFAQRVHVIRDEDTLQSIAREYFGTAERYLDIYRLNTDVLSNPEQLPSGVEIRIPAD